MCFLCTPPTRRAHLSEQEKKGTRERGEGGGDRVSSNVSKTNGSNGGPVFFIVFLSFLFIVSAFIAPLSWLSRALRAMRWIGPSVAEPDMMVTLQVVRIRAGLGRERELALRST